MAPLRTENARPRCTATPALTRLVAIVAAACALLALASCTDSTTAYVPVGARGKLSTTMGPCSPTGAAGPLRFTDSSNFEALRTGTARVTCRDGEAVVEVRTPTRLAIDRVAEASTGQPVFYRAVAYDADGHPLDLGPDTPLRWTFSGSLGARPVPGCGDILPLCAAPNGGYALAGAAGVGTAAVAFGHLRATTTTTVTGR